MVPPKVARPISFTSLRTLALILALAICSAAPAQDFIRGEANGNGSVAIEDVIYLMNYFYESGLAPVNACGAFTFDLADINDNEYLTIADPLRLAEALFLGGSIPAPYPTCGPDPSNQTNGFDVIDTAYKVRLLGPFDGIDTSGGNPQRTAGFEVGINVPSAVRAVELYFQYDPAELSNPRYQGVHPLTIGEVAFGVIRLTLQGAFSPLDVHPGLNRLGEIVFDVAPGVLAPQLDWVPVFSAAFFRRATIVDDVLEDHHPEFIAVDASVFIRGDLDANGIRNVQDLIIWLVTYTTGSPQPVSLCDLGPSEAADVNDNEFLTVADFLLLGVQLFCGGTAEIPTPNYCGVDPGSEMDDFDLVDPAYSVRAERFTLIGAGPVERDVEIPLWILTPEPVRGVEFTLDLGTPNLTLDSPFFEPAGTLVDPVSANRQEGSLLHVVIASTCSSIIEGSAEWQELGILKLHLAGVVLPNPIQWLPDATLGTSEYRASVVTADFRDHHPLLLAGERIFQRGNSNNGGVSTPVDIGDAIWMLSYLSGTGAHPPCLDAGDANDDGKLDFADPIYILGYLTGMLPPMPTPFPACDYELDIDELDCQDYDCI